MINADMGGTKKKKKKEEEEGEERISTQYSKHEIDAYLFNINYNIMQIRVSKYKNLNN